MATDLTVKDVMTRAYLGVSESDPIREVAELLIDEDASVVAVIRGTELLGGVNERQLLAALLGNELSGDTPIKSCMTERPPTIQPDATLTEAATILADANTRHLFVKTAGELEGVLSENDVLTAVTSLMTTESMEEREEEVASAMNTDLKAEAEDAGHLSVQSVCEVCGTLKSDLMNYNGQLVCQDCRSV